MNDKQVAGAGHFDQQGNPCITLTVRGKRGRSATFEAILDTGFSGFVLLPLMQALALELDFQGTTSVTLADESRVAMFTALGTAICFGRAVEGLVQVPRGPAAPLVGMDFLRRFEMGALISRATGVTLVDEERLRSLIDEGL